jgi:hypothetical protein
MLIGSGIHIDVTYEIDNDKDGARVLEFIVTGEYSVGVLLDALTLGTKREY